MSGHNINYKKIYFTLVALLVLSVAGPFLGIFWVTIITAFGIAFVKANLVIQNFMHLRAEKRIVKWVLVMSLVLMAVFVAGVAPDVMKHEGVNWENTAARAAIARGLGGGGHGEPAEHDEGGAEDHDAAEPAADHEEDDAAADDGFDAQAAYNGFCTACHGIEGDGAGPAGAALDPHPANFTDPAFWADRDEDRIFNAIKNGGASVGASPMMAPWGTTFTDDQIHAIVGYIETAFRP